MSALISNPTFAICSRLRAAFPIIRDEVARTPEHLWLGWPNQADVRGDVRVLPLHLQYRPAMLPRVEEQARALCPQTWELLRGAPLTIVFSRMQPGCRVLPHRDLDGPDHLRCHLGIDVPDGAWMRVDGQRCQWRNGECVAFDPRQTHEVANDGATARTILIVDFLPTEHERKAVGYGARSASRSRIATVDS